MERFLNRPKASFRASVVISGEVLIAPKVQRTFCHERATTIEYLPQFTGRSQRVTVGRKIDRIDFVKNLPKSRLKTIARAVRKRRKNAGVLGRRSILTTRVLIEKSLKNTITAITSTCFGRFNACAKIAGPAHQACKADSCLRVSYLCRSHLARVGR
jgi:hypothetical protein